MKERRKLHSNCYTSMQLLCHLNIFKDLFIRQTLTRLAAILLINIFNNLNHILVFAAVYKVNFLFLLHFRKLSKIGSII
jgi:hypothetical protein